MLHKYKVDDLASLERKLQERSMSLATLQTQFTERVLSSELERKYVPDDYEFSRAELLAYYEDHAADWNVTARAKWRELCVRFNKHSREEAEALIKGMGNEVYLGGAPFEAVAKQRSEGFSASDGGLYDWTTQGSLKSKAIDQAVFSLPLRRLSQVIEDDIGFHIIEVLEREPGHKKSFDAAQAEIRKHLSDEKTNQALERVSRKSDGSNVHLDAVARRHSKQPRSFRCTGRRLSTLSTLLTFAERQRLLQKNRLAEHCPASRAGCH